MSKKNKKDTKPSVETKVEAVVETPAVDQNNFLVVAQTKTRAIYVYKSPDEVSLSESAKKTANIYNGFADFKERVSDNEINEAAIGFNIDMMGLVESGLRKSCVWNWMIANAKEHKRDMTVVRSERTGVKKEGKLSNRSYVLVSDKIPEGIKLAPQAISCLGILKACVSKDGTVSEADLKLEVDKHQEALHTRQDPWRIFQYYRPQLIQHHLLRMT